MAAYKNDGSRAKALIQAGAAVNARDLDGITPLQWAVVSNNDRVASVLIACGANVHNVDNYQKTALLQAVTANRHVILALLLQNGATFEGLLGKNRSMLRDIAESADIATLKQIPDTIILGPGLNVEEQQVLLGLEIIASRSDTSTDLTEAFNAFLKPRLPRSRGSTLEAIVEIGPEDDALTQQASEDPMFRRQWHEISTSLLVSSVRKATFMIWQFQARMLSARIVLGGYMCGFFPWMFMVFLGAALGLSFVYQDGAFHSNSIV